MSKGLIKSNLYKKLNHFCSFFLFFILVYVIIKYMRKLFLIFLALIIVMLPSCTSTVSMNIMRPAQINIPSKKICAIGYIASYNENYIQYISDTLTRKLDDSNYFESVYSYKQCENIIQSKSKYYTKILSKDRLFDEICSYFNEGTIIKIELNESYSEDPAPQKKQKPYRSEIQNDPDLAIHGYKNDTPETINENKSTTSDSSTHITGQKNTDSATSQTTQSNKTEEQEVTPYYHYGRLKITMYFSIIDPQTQSILKTITYTDEQEDTCLYENYKPGIHDRYKMALLCFDNIINRFIKDLTPHREQVSVSFISDKNFSQLDNAVYLLDNGYYNQGLEILENYAKTEYGNDVINAKAAYNYGMILALTGEYDESAIYLLRAYKLQSKNSKYKSALEFLKKEKANAEKLKNQLSK